MQIFLNYKPSQGGVMGSNEIKPLTQIRELLSNEGRLLSQLTTHIFLRILEFLSKNYGKRFDGVSSVEV